MTGSLCIGPDCARPAVARGLCRAHYHQRERHPSRPLRPLRAKLPSSGRPRRGPDGQLRPCSVAGCGRPVHARELCAGHYSQRSRGLKLRPLGPRTGPKHETPGQAAAPHTWTDQTCAAILGRSTRSGEPGQRCGKPVHCRGLCANHYVRMLRRDQRCSAPGCDRPTSTGGQRGLCSTCYRRRRAGGAIVSSGARWAKLDGSGSAGSAGRESCG